MISEMFIAVWGLPTDKVIVWGSSAMAVVGGLSIITVAIFMLTPLCRLLVFLVLKYSEFSADYE